jgi:hypothetical protein
LAFKNHEGRAAILPLVFGLNWQVLPKMGFILNATVCFPIPINKQTKKKRGALFGGFVMKVSAVSCPG